MCLRDKGSSLIQEYQSRKVVSFNNELVKESEATGRWWIVVVHSFNPCTQETEAGQPGVQSQFQDSQDYTEKPCL